MRLPVQAAIVCKCGNRCGWDGKPLSSCPRQLYIIINQYGKHETLYNEKGEKILDEKKSL